MIRYGKLYRLQRQGGEFAEAKKNLHKCLRVRYGITEPNELLNKTISILNETITSPTTSCTCFTYSC